MTLEELPPVLVLHLKRFVFEKTGGCQKLVKNIDYPVDLEISKGAYFIFMKLFYCVHILAGFTSIKLDGMITR